MPDDKSATTSAPVAATPSTEEHSTCLPSEPTAIQRIFECQHILESIARHATRNTQIACLRVNRRFFLAAGPPLYHTVKVDGDNMMGFFRGVLIDTGIKDDIDCDFIKAGKKCKHSDEKKSADNSPSQQAEDDPGTPTASILELPTGLPNNTGSPKKKKNKNNKKRKKNKAQATASNPAESKKNLPAAQTNFKADLLKHVRVLTVGSHHHCFCDLYGLPAAAFIDNIEVLRIVPDFMFTFKLDTVCDNEDAPCEFFSNLLPRKIVIRNLDAQGSPVPDFCEPEWVVPGLEEVVYFFPMDGRRYDTSDGYHGMGTFSLGELFENVNKVKIVFYSTWEGWDETDDLMGFIHGSAGVTLDDIVYPISHIAMYMETEYTIYGFEKVNFVPGGDLARVFQQFFPNKALTRFALREAARHELRAGTLSAHLSRFRDDEKVEYDNDFEELIKYKTLAEYMKDVKGRRGEINADD